MNTHFSKEEMQMASSYMKRYSTPLITRERHIKTTVRNCLPNVDSCLFGVCLFFCYFFGPLPWHMEVPRLGVESEL